MSKETFTPIILVFSAFLFTSLEPDGHRPYGKTGNVAD